jgi:serine/threonine protein kinase
VRKYTQKILQGLQYLHQNHIVHGDIKAANILVNNDGVVKLSDFGHSRVVQQGNSIADSIRGTPMWMAPEVITDSRHGKPSDIWSLGCTIIEMMTGDLPWPDFVKLEPFAIMYKIAQTKTGPPIPDDVGQECRDFLAKCFVVDCTKRATVDVLLQHPFITQFVDLKEAPKQQQVSPQPHQQSEQINLTPRRTSSMQNGPPSSIHSELDLMNSRIDKILREQSPTRTMRVQSSPAMGAEMSPVSHGRNGKRQSQPVDSYASYSSQASQYQSYVSQQQSYMQQQQMLQQQQQQSYLQQQQQPYPSPRQRYTQPPNDGDMSTEYMYSPQNH